MSRAGRCCRSCPARCPRTSACLPTNSWPTQFRLLRRFHDATGGSPLAAGAEVVCHGDVSPCNTVLRDGRPAALIDFDAAAPGRRLDDLAYGLFLWLDLGNVDIALDDQRRRLELAAAAYGAPVDPALLAEIARQVAITTERLRREGRRESAAWWAAMHRWVLDHAAALAPGDGQS